MVGRGGIEPPTPGFSVLCGPLPANDLRQVSQQATQKSSENTPKAPSDDTPSIEAPQAPAIDPDVLALAQKLSGLTPEVRKALTAILNAGKL
jgi:hypothetical protein